jgi:hypothetical protein
VLDWRLMGGPPGGAYRHRFEANDPLALAAASRGLRDWPVASAADLDDLPSLHYTGTADPFADRVRNAAHAMGGTLLELDGADHLHAPARVSEIVTAVEAHLARGARVATA